MLYPQQNDIRSTFDLSGFWDFALDPESGGEGAAWYNGLENPRQIAVPGSWNEQFQDTRDYLGRVWYVRRFYVPSGWQGQDVFVRVGSANYAAKVWINGEAAGEHQGGHLPFDLEITAQLRWGEENTIAITVENELLPTRVPPGNVRGGILGGFMANYPAASFDFYPYGGLHRPVILWSAPRARIADATVTTTIVGADGIVTVIVERTGEGGVGRARLVGENVAADEPLVFEESTAQTAIRVPDARLWSPDDPYLYDLEVILSDRATSDRYTLQVGIRTVQVQGDQLLLNGEPVFLKGFGKHEDFPVHGRGLNMPLIVKDASLFEWMGANSYRTSHYPYSDEAMMIADRKGILIIDEIPAVGLMFEDGEGNIATRLAMCKQQLHELVARDKNHPSVIMWSVANEPMPPNMLRRFTEGGGGDDEGVERGVVFFQALYDLAHELDSTRPATSAAVMGCPMAWMALSDVVLVNRYWGWYTQGGQLVEGAEALAQELDGIHDQLQKPIVVSEFGADTIAGMHADPPEMWSEEYQVEFLRGYLDVAAARPFVVGMHVWNFADFKTAQASSRAGGLNLKGVFTRDRRPKMAAHFLRERWTDQTGSRPPDPQAAGAEAQGPSAQTVPGGLAALAQRLDGKNPGMTATLKFALGDKTFRLVFEDGACRAEEGDGEADTTVTMAPEDAMALFMGKLNAMIAFTTGKIKVTGDMKALMALRSAFA